MARKSKVEKTETPVEVEEQITPPVVVAPREEGPKKIKVTSEELAKLQADGRLIGYDPVTSEALIR